MADQDIEQYRAGFEAWARGKDFDVSREGVGYLFGSTDRAWAIWIASKREASAEPSAWMCPAAVEPEFTADALLAGYWMRKGRKVTPLYTAVAGGAQKDEALENDAACWRYIEEHATTHGGGNGFTITCFVPVDHEDMQCGILAAISADTKAQEKKA